MGPRISATSHLSGEGLLLRLQLGNRSLSTFHSLNYDTIVLANVNSTQKRLEREEY